MKIDTIIKTIYLGKQDEINKLALQHSEQAIQKAEQMLATFRANNVDKDLLVQLKQLRDRITKGEYDLDIVRLTVNCAVRLSSPFSSGEGTKPFVDLVFDLLKRNQIFALEDYAYCFATLLFSGSAEKKRLAEKFISGDKLTAPENKILNLTLTELSPTDIAKRIFPNILRILHDYGEEFNMIFVFVDEFEKIVLGMNKARRFEFLEDLRNLIDYNLSQFSLVLGCSTEAYEAIRGTSPAFADRNRDVVDLPHIKTLADMKSLVEIYLLDKRTPNFSGPSTHPFSDSALIAISRNENGSPRYILEACHKILNFGLQSNAKIIDDAMLKNWYGK